ncbi:Fanconi anemia group G protein isoform X2 [Amia ocellicauda]|uniref:Fanconi anemia group G protein isoform X2 n=1 Tax=Amia ocellicauda TaxID=2972642 RepID=UPI00346436C1
MDPAFSIGRTDCWDIWTDENNSIVKKWKSFARIKKREHANETLRQCHYESNKLLQKIQGLPPVAARLPLELTVLYNTLLFSFSLSGGGDTGEELLSRGLVRGLEALSSQAPSRAPLDLWRATLQVSSGTELAHCVHQLACVQWAQWLSTCQLQSIRELALLLTDSWTENLTSLGDFLAAIREVHLSVDENPACSVALSSGEFRELLHVCSVVAQGVVQMEGGQLSEALLAFQEAAGLSCSRTLLAQVHTLTGICLSKLGRPQSALQCHRKALETDFGCLSALYQSSLVFRQLGVVQAEIEALSLLHSAVACPSSTEAGQDWTALIAPVTLLCSPAVMHMLSTPALLGVKYSLAQRSLHSRRFSEAVEHYLDLLASFHQEGQQPVTTGHSPHLPRIPEIYLEAALALLKAKRHWDAIVVCEEVVSKTVVLIPDQLAVPLSHAELRDPGSTEPSDEACEGKWESLNFVLWAAAAYFLQGQAFTCLKDSKEAVTHFTRCISLLVKVHVQHTGWQCEGTASGVQALQRLKVLAFTARGVSFMERQQEKEALHNFQLSLQASPGSAETELWLLEALWRLGRREEAAAYWRKSQGSTQSPTTEDTEGEYNSGCRQCEEEDGGICQLNDATLEVVCSNVQSQAQSHKTSDTSSSNDLSHSLYLCAFVIVSFVQ